MNECMVKVASSYTSPLPSAPFHSPYPLLPFNSSYFFSCQAICLSTHPPLPSSPYTPFSTFNPTSNSIYNTYFQLQPPLTFTSFPQLLSIHSTLHLMPSHSPS